MPTYEYHCKECGHVQEDFVKLISKKKHKLKCKRCGGICKSVISKDVQVYFKEERRWGTTDVGKKIREKNDMLKARESDYESASSGKDGFRKTLGQ